MGQTGGNMLKAYRQAGEGLIEVTADQVETALWIDLLQPTADEVAQVAALGLTVPPLSEMEEIEISNRPSLGRRPAPIIPRLPPTRRLRSPASRST